MNHSDRNWTVSTDERRIGDAYSWSVFCEGKRVLGGYPTPDDARWALGMLRIGEVPPYRPNGEEIVWPEGMVA